MIPVRRNIGGERVDALEAATEAWALAWQQMIETGAKAIKSNSFLVETKQADVEIAATPSETVFQIDKVRVLHYRPLAEKKANTPPVLICYGLFGRQTMIDLQEDRSLVRNLLSEGIDVYVVDWGNPTRADQYLKNSARYEGEERPELREALAQGPAARQRRH